MAETSTIKELRDTTGLSFDKIKAALDEAGGDKDKAREILMAQAGAAAAKKADREATEGTVSAYIHTNGKIGAMVQLACETDFVARNADFQELAHDLAMHASAMRPASAAEMLDQLFVKDPNITVKDLIHQAVQKLGENIRLIDVTVLAI
ncbi:MAG TPA: elongation factor Ts [Candidatus Paceibacterota bacterium]|nr:elongation factor Ts [Candidatus Paceibacterota bacterium]